MTYKELTVKQYFEILDALKDTEEPIQVTEALVKIIFNEDLATLNIQTANKLIKELDFLNEAYKPSKPKRAYKIDDMEFNPVFDITKITTAQYIDFQTLIKLDNKKLLMNCLFIRKGESYGDNDYSDLLYSKMSIADYLDVLDFFRIALKRLTADTLDSSLKMMKRLWKAKKNPEMLIKIVRMKAARLALNEDGLI